MVSGTSDADAATLPAAAHSGIVGPTPGATVGRYVVLDILGSGGMGMVLRGYDASESWAGFELLPFRIDIPHDDVEFETAKWDVRESEKPKLDDAYDKILEAIHEHGRDLKARLYVLGHTDTVGNPADNQRLSQRRARAIAEYCRARGGISLPVMSRGFGESQLAVKTADSVDEPRNRRAQYILAAQAPAAGSWAMVSAGK